MSKAPKPKVLFTSHTANFSKFNRPFMRWFSEQGYEVHYASMGEEGVLDTDVHHTVPFHRSPFSLNNIKAYFQLKKIIDSEKYEIIHTHTPMGSVVTRLAARQARRQGTRVIYTAHGFHFYTGAPVLNWLLYYPVEKYMARHTDTLITINREDYDRASRKFTNTNVEYMPGVGVDLKKFKPPTAKQKAALRKKYGFSDDDFIMTYVAEFIDRKNHAFFVKSMPELLKQVPAAKLVFVGKGELLDKMKELARTLGVDSRIEFMGYRKDVNAIFQASDVCISASKQEGLPINVVEGMATGLPVIATKTRGHLDIAEHHGLSWLFPRDDEQSYVHIVSRVYKNQPMHSYTKINPSRQTDIYSLESALAAKRTIYGNNIGKRA